MSEQRGLPSSGASGAYDGQDELASALAEFARSAQQQQDRESTLAEIVRAAVELIPGCDDGSISVVFGRKTVWSRAASSGLAGAVDRLQESTGQGPCLDAAYLHETVRVSDMASEDRWPVFAPQALQAGAAGMLSCQMWVDGDDLGALNLFSRTAGALDEESEHIALMFAAHAAVAYAAAQKQEAQARSVATRQVIGRAEGIIMERHKVTAEQAFAMLVRISQHRNVKLREIAEGLVLSGRLEQPPGATGPAPLP
ncbi:MAG: histidine kinase [Frankiales bacterium]|nr:histidine kinase [Frankiales bacterium]